MPIVEAQYCGCACGEFPKSSLEGGLCRQQTGAMTLAACRAASGWGDASSGLVIAGFVPV
jgi:hypothetical protein